MTRIPWYIDGCRFSGRSYRGQKSILRQICYSSLYAIITNLSQLQYFNGSSCVPTEINVDVSLIKHFGDLLREIFKFYRI